MDKKHLPHLTNAMFDHDLKTSKIDNRWKILLQCTRNLCESLRTLLYPAHMVLSIIHHRIVPMEEMLHLAMSIWNKVLHLERVPPLSLSKRLRRHMTLRPMTSSSVRRGLAKRSMSRRSMKRHKNSFLVKVAPERKKLRQSSPVARRRHLQLESIVEVLQKLYASNMHTELFHRGGTRSGKIWVTSLTTY